MKWNNLEFWKYGEWDVIKEILRDKRNQGILYNPSHSNLFQAMEAVPFKEVRVVVVGQDPYPEHRMATGIAFSIPPEIKKEDYPPTLKNIFKEYCSDLGYPYPETGDLSKWCKQGVFLWNAIPTCDAGKPKSHHYIHEWSYLTREIVEKLDEKGNCVFILLGRNAGSLLPLIRNSHVIQTSHPSPLGANKGFLGSKIFSRTNQLLEKPIDWRLE